VSLYTKNGKPLTRSGDDIFDQSGRHVARLDGDRAFGPNGRYVATLDGDRLVYRSTDSARISGAFLRQSRVGGAHASGVKSGMWGDEPKFD